MIYCFVGQYIFASSQDNEECCGQDEEPVQLFGE